MLFNYSYIILGRITKPEKATFTASRVLADSIPSVNKRIKKRNLLPLKLNYGSEVSGLFNSIADAVCALVFLEEELRQKGLGPVLHWSISKGLFPIIKDENRNSIIGGKELPALKQILIREKSKNRFFIRTNDREDDFYLLQGLLIWDFVTEMWNLKRDKEILTIFLDGYDYKYAADILNIARPQAWRKYQSMQMPAYFNIREILLSGRLTTENGGIVNSSLQINKP